MADIYEGAYTAEEFIESAKEQTDPAWASAAALISIAKSLDFITGQMTASPTGALPVEVYHNG